LPKNEGEGIPEAPEQIRWNRISTFNEGAKVYIGGKIKLLDNRLIFTATKENPLMVIFYNCPDDALTYEIIRAARTRNEYWNNITPISLATGALGLVYVAALFLNRPAFRRTVITALVAIIAPILPMFPPGLLLTVLYRRMTWQARRLRAFWDLARLPLRYLPGRQESSILSTGEKYGYAKLTSLTPEIAGTIPFLVPEYAKEKRIQWRLYGVIKEGEALPVKSSIDPFVSFGLLPADPALLARRYAVRAYALEALAWLMLLMGIGLNVIFIFLILSLFGRVSF
jgi:hypothetical protein